MKFTIAFIALLIASFGQGEIQANRYTGTLGGNPVTFVLTWVNDTSVVGCITRDASPSEVFTLAGDNSRDGELFFTVASQGRNVAHLKAKKTREGKVITWKGSLRVESDGSILPVTFSRAVAVP